MNYITLTFGMSHSLIRPYKQLEI